MLESRILFSADLLSISLDGGQEQDLPEPEVKDWYTAPLIPANSTAAPSPNSSNTDSDTLYNLETTRPPASDNGSNSPENVSPLNNNENPGDAEAATPDQPGMDPAVIEAPVQSSVNQSTSIGDETSDNDESNQSLLLTANRIELIFIDAGVENSDQLLTDLKTHRADNTEWIVIHLDSDRDGIEEITETLDGIVDIDAIHIISHGDGHGLQLGTSRLDASSIDHYDNDLTAWGQSLTDDADLLIYGCDLASTEIGRRLVDSIADSTNSDVAASTDATGHKQLGADWNLEYTSGTVETGVAFSAKLQNDWAGTLATDSNIVSSASPGLSVNHDGGNNVYLLAEDGGVLLGGLTSFTYEVQFSINTTDDVSLVSYATASSVNEISFMLGGAATAQLDIGGTQISLNGIDYSTLADGSDQQLTITWDNASGDWTVLNNGSLIDSGTGLATGEVIEAGGTLLFGQDQDSVEGGFQTDQVFSGIFYNARFFSDVRTTEQALASYASSLPYDEPGLIAQWNFNALSADGVITETVSGNNLTVKHTNQSGFTTSTPELAFSINENALNGTVVGQLSGVDAERDARIASLLAADTNLRYSAETGKFYKLVQTDVTWASANTSASGTTLDGVAGQLGTILSAAEQNLFTGFYTDINDQIWLGGNDSDVEAKWRWQETGANGDLFWQGTGTGYSPENSYTNWSGINPGNASGDHDYLLFSNAAGDWQDNGPADLASYVIEWNADDVLDATQALTYSIQSQTVANAFAIDASTGQITVADGSLLDYETNLAHVVTIRTTDVDNNTYDKPFTVSLSNLAESNHVPTDLSSGIEINTDGGNDTFLRAADGDAILGNLDAFTLEILVQFEGTPTDPLATLVKYTADSSPIGNSVFFVAYNSGNLALNIENNNFTSTVATAEIFDGEVHHLAVTWDNTNGDVRFYVDGTLIDQQTGLHTGLLTTDGGGTAELDLGQYVRNESATSLDVNPFHGTYYDVRIWNDVRSEAEISHNYQQKLDSNNLPDGLAANWQMEFNGSSEVIDIVSEGTTPNRLSIGHATGTGFTTSTPVTDLHASENANNGDSVGFVVPTNPDSPRDIVQDGSFQIDTPFTVFAPDSFGSWTVTQGNVNVVTSWDPGPLGGNTVDLQGNGSSNGEIQQSLTTEVGRQYQVVFAMAGNFTGGEAVKDLRVSTSGTSHDFTATEPVNYDALTNIGWSNRSFTFTADSTATDLSFLSTDAVSAFGPLITDIRVIEIPQAISTILNNDPTLSYDAATGKFYRVVDSQLNFDDALNAAVVSSLNGVPGEMLTIGSAHENDLALNWVYEHGESIWLGLTDSTAEGTWVEYNGAIADGVTVLTAGAAVAGQYSNVGDMDGTGGEDHARIGADGQWHDLHRANGPFNYVVQWEASEVLSSYTYTLTDTASGRFTIDTSTGEIIVADGSKLDYEIQASHTITVQVTDAAGNSYSEAMSVTIDDRIEPGQTVPGPQTVNEDQILTFSGANAVTVSDEFALTNPLLQVLLTVNDGILTLSQTTGLTVVEGSDGSSTFVINGTESDLNNALDGMTFQPDPDFNGSVALDMTTSIGADLAGHYTFDGRNANDQSAGVDQNGIFNGDATTIIDATRGEVLSLDGTGDSVSIASTFDNPASVTLSAWVNLTAGEGDLISLGDNITLRIDDVLQSNGVMASYRTGATFNTFGSGEFIAGTGWRHVALTLDDASNTQTIYIDGLAVASESFTESIDYTLGTQTFIGAHGNGGTAYNVNGLIDDARVYDRALSAEEITALASNQASDVIGPDLTQSFTSFNGDINGGDKVFIHDDLPPFNSEGSISSLQLAADADTTPIDFDLLVLRPDGGGGFEVTHRVSLTDSDVVSTTAGIRTLDIGKLSVQSGDVLAHWSANNTGSIPYSAGSGGSTGWSLYLDSDDLAVGSTVLESLDSTDARVYGLSVNFQPTGLLQADSVAITVNPVNDAPTFVQPEPVGNGTLDGTLTGWTTTGTVSLTANTMRFGVGNAVGPHTASQVIQTATGGTYQLSFDYRDDNPGRTQSLQVTVDGSSNLLTTPQIITDESGTTFVRYTYSFTADSNAATITFTDTSDTAGVADGSGGVDGYIDNISVTHVSEAMSDVTFVEDGAAVTLDSDITVFDADLSALDDFGSATLTLTRNTTANAEDVFSVNGNLVLNAGVLELSAINIGSYTNTSGTLTLTFGTGVTNAQVNEVIQAIQYSNTSDTPPGSVQIDWVFNDNNTANAQGSGTALTATAITTVNIQPAADLVITSPASTTTDEDTVFVYFGATVISVDDGIATDTLVQVTLSVANGTLLLADLTGITIVEGADDSSSMIIEGLESDINVALDGLTYAPDKDYNGGDTLNITTAIAANLVGNYTFEGANANDSSAGTAHDGNFAGNATTAVDGTRGEVLSLDGDGDFITVSGLYNNPTNVTLAAWVNLTSVDTSGADIISIGDSIAIRAHDNIEGAMIAYFYDGTDWNEINSGVTLTGTGWHHVAYSIDDVNDSQRLYLDGVLVAEQTLTSSINYTQGTNTVIGGHGNGSPGYDFNGTIDDARVYTRALSAEEIAALATDQTTATDTVAITVNPINDSPMLLTNTGVGTIIGGTVAIDSAALNVGDPDDSGTELTYTVSSVLNGQLELTTTPGVAINSFTQADVDSGLLVFVHDGLSGSNGSFNLSLADGGEDSAIPATDTYFISINGATSDSYSTDEETNLSIDAASGLLANDGQSGSLVDGNTVVGFDATTDTDGNSFWSSNVGSADLTLSGATYTTSPDNAIPGINAAFDFSGVSSGATTPALDSFAEIDGTQSATLEAWVYIDSLSGNNMIFDTGDIGNTGITLVTSGGQLILGVANAGSLSTNSITAPTAGSWHHIALSIKMKSGVDQISLYVDGSQQMVTSLTLSNWGPGAFGLGTTNGTTVGGYSGDLAGQIAHFRVHDQDLDAATISYNAANPGAGSASPYVESIDQSSTLGSVTASADGSFDYDPNGQFEALGTGDSITDSFTYVYNDGIGNTETASVTLTINGVNDAPVQSSIETTALSYTENDGSVAVTTSLTITDIDDAQIQAATVSISSNFTSGEDALSFTNQPGITGFYNSGTGILSLNGAATLADYQTALRSITYQNNSENPSELTRTVTYSVYDGQATSASVTRDIQVNRVNDPPVASSIESSPFTYTENDGPVSITSTISISDIDDSLIESAIVSITGNYTDGEDSVVFVDQLGITGSFNTTTGELSLSGSSSRANYETALRSVTFENASEDPTTLTRTITFAANDGDADSNLQSRNINISRVNDAPVLASIESANATYTENTAPITISSTVAVTDVDDTQIESATVTISNNFALGEDVLNFTNQFGITGNYNLSTGTLSLSGSSSLANYEAAVRSITYENTSDNPSTMPRTVTYLVYDGNLQSNSQDRIIDIDAINDAPVTSLIETGATNYTENDAATIVTSTIAITDTDDTLIESATVAITSNFSFGEDLLGFSTLPGITGTYNSTTGVLTLSGSSSITNYETVLRSVTYENISENPDTLTRTVSFTVYDGDVDSNVQSRLISITPVNDSPVQSSLESTPLAVTENDSPVSITSTLSLTDIDDTLIESATAHISANFIFGEDFLAFVSQSGITGSYNATTGVLSLTGSATVADYQTALQSVTYENTSDNPSTLNRTLSIVVHDGDANSNVLTRDISISAVNDAPVQAAIEPGALAYSENGTPAAVTSTLVISDVDDTLIESATVAISNNFVFGEDVLSYTSQPGVTGSYNASTGILSLSGSSSLAIYQAVLRSVTYENISDDPSTLIRTVAFTINDGDIDSNTLTRAISVSPSNDAPVQSSIETSTLTYTENDSPVPVTAALVLSDSDDTNLESAAISISGNFSSGQDTLAFSDQSGISGNYNATSGVLTLTGSTTVADYETALRSITYENTSDDPSTLTRTLSFTVNDGDVDSNLQSRDIAIIAVNDAPVQSAIESSPLAVTENDSPVNITSALSLADSDDTILESATVTISSNFTDSEDLLAFINQSGITGNYNPVSGVLTLTGSATVADYEVALQSVTYENTSDNPSTLDRTLSFVVNDGDADSNLLTRDIDIAAINDAPVQVSIETGALPYAENDPPTIITSTLAITDIDDTLLESATVAINGNFVSGEDVLAFTTQPGITGIYNSFTGILSLSGSSSLSNYQTALRSVTYENISDDPSALTRTVTFSINDGDISSNTLSRDINLSTSNDAPVQSSIETTTLVYTENSTPLPITTALVLSDLDDTHLESATVSISANFVSAEDTLAFTNQSGISSSYDAFAGVLTLTGPSTVANYESALRSVTYVNTSDNPSTLSRTILFGVNDGDADSNTLSRDISIFAVNDAPVQSGIESSTLAVTENDPPASVTATLGLADSDDTLIESATVTISANFIPGEDTLAFSNQSGITGSYNTTTGILSLTGSATVADYETALRSVTYQNNSDNPSILSRTLSFIVNDGDAGSNVVTRDISITATNDAPVQASIETAALPYSENDPPTIVTSTLVISDADDTLMESASISIIANFVAGEDVLSFTTQPGVAGSYNSSTGVLSLNGSSSLANYQAAIRSVTYENISDDPSTVSRTVAFTINDGDISSNVLSRDINLSASNDAPVQSSIENTTLIYTENETAVPVTAALVISDLDDTNIESASINISGNFTFGEDALGFTNQSGISGSYNATNGILTLTGSATLANYEIALRSVTYENTSDDPSVLTRTISYVVNDGNVDSNLQSRDVAIVAVNDAPVQSGIEITDLVITENDAPAIVTSTLSLADRDDALIESASVAITNNFTSGEDLLAFTNQLLISGNYNSTTGVLTLTGSATVQDYETALRSITYQNVSDNPSTQTRTITFTVNDGDIDSNIQTRNASTLPINDAPVGTNIESTPLNYTENGVPIALTNSITLSDFDDTLIESATVIINGNLSAGEDILTFTNQPGITGTYDASTGVLLLSGSSSLTNYETALRSVSYQNTSDNPSTLTRSIDIFVNDGDIDSNTVSRNIEIQPTNDSPVNTSIEATAAAYTENDPPLTLTSTLSISDIDDTLLESATISISNNFTMGEDLLSFTPQPGISGSYNSTSGILTLTGTSSLANYEAVFRSVTYENLSDNPNTLTRATSFISNDGDIDSNLQTRDIVISPVNDSPVASNIEITPLSYTENDTPTLVSSILSLADIDDTLLESATISISANFSTGEDILTFTGQPGITGSYDNLTGILSLTGSSSVANYQTALQSVRYENTSDNPSVLSRQITFTVNDGDIDSNLQTRTLSFSAVNDAPEIVSIEAPAVQYTENDAPTIITSAIILNDLDDTVLQSATVTISGNYASQEDLLTFIDQSGITGTFDQPTGVLTLSGASSVANYESALQSVTYNNSSDDPSDLTRTITFEVADATTTSNTITRDIGFTAVNDTPATTLIETASLLLTENDVAKSVTQNLTLTDPDNTNLVSAQVIISGNYQTGEDLLSFTASSGITGNFDSLTGTLTLSGSASVAQYETALRNVTYTNLSDNPDTTIRAVSISVSDGLAQSNLSTRLLEIAAVNDAPQQSTIETTPLLVVENDSPVIITQTLSLFDHDDSFIDSASISITSNFTPSEDALLFTNQTGISGSYDTTTGVLSLSGSASIADYQQALRSVTYANNSDHPNPLDRQITFTVNDGVVDSNVISRLIEITRVNDTPAISAVEPIALLYIENFGPAAVSSSIALSELDDVNLESATVQISNYKPGEDILDYVSIGNITASWDLLSGILTLSGTDTIAAYEAALRSVTYENISDNPNDSTRTILYTVNDGDIDSNIAQREIQIIVSNDRPVQNSIEIDDLVYIENSGAAVITSTLSMSDLDDQVIESALIKITSGYLSNQDVLSFSNTTTITASWNPATAELVLTGPDTIAAYQAALRTVSYENTTDNPSTIPRTVAISINDGDTDSNLLSRNIIIVAVNDSPVNHTIENTTLDYSENAGGVIITSSLVVGDVDDEFLNNAIVTISDGYHPAEDLLIFTDTPNITGNWDSVNGIMTLTGSDTTAAYQDALRAVLYENTSDDPTLDSRTLDFLVSDGSLFSNTLTRIITIADINDAPSGTDTALTFLEDTNFTVTRADFGYSDNLDNNVFSAVTINLLPVNGLLSLDGVPVSAGQIIDITDIDANLLVFSPEPHLNGPAYDSFDFQVHDDGGAANTGAFIDPQPNRITFNVTNVNDAPSGANNTVTTPEDTGYVFTQQDFMFTDPLDSDSFAGLVITSLPNTGSLTNSGIALSAGDIVNVNEIDNGLLIYTPPLNDTGIAYNGFGFQVQDTGGAANGGVFTDPTENFMSFDVPGINDAPLLITEETTVDEGSENLLTTAVLSATDADDLLATELTFALDSVPLHGTLTLNGNLLVAQDTFSLEQIQSNQLIYTHDGSETDSDFFDVTVADGGENGTAPSSGRFSLIITEVIDPAPILEGDELTLEFGQSFDSLDGDLLASGFNTLSNGGLSTNTVFLVEIEDQPMRGTVELNQDGTFSYVHDESPVLVDSFSYRVTNEDGVFTIVQVNITIEPPLSSAFGEPTKPAVVIPLPEEEEEAENIEETISPESEPESEPETESSTEDSFEEPQDFGLVPQTEFEEKDIFEVINNLNANQAVKRVSLGSTIDDLGVSQHNNVRSTTFDYGDSVVYSNAGFEVLLEVKTLKPQDIVSNKSFLDGLSRLESDLQQSDEQSGKRYRLANDAGFGASLSATAGILAWVLRGSALFASAMASTPLWASMDPTRVVSIPRQKDVVSDADKEVEHYFSEQK